MSLGSAGIGWSGRLHIVEIHRRKELLPVENVRHVSDGVSATAACSALSRFLFELFAHCKSLYRVLARRWAGLSVSLCLSR